jgi:biotin carboxylase
MDIYYEHPRWFDRVFAALDRRGVSYRKRRVTEHIFDPAAPYDGAPVVFNRMSPSAYTRGRAHLISYTTQYLEHLDRLGVRVVNDRAAWRTEVSKAYQLTLLESLGLPYPRARVIHDPAQAAGAARGLRLPVIVKPNIGGSGAGIKRFDSIEGLSRAAAEGTLDLGIDQVALVQEYVPAEADRIVRVEVLDGAFLYAIRIYTPGDSFNLCPADVCQGIDGAELARPACPVDAPKNSLRVEGYTPPRDIVQAVERITAAGGIELGGVEYMIDARDGRPYFYDVNALSNFVADAPRVVGFDPFARLADWLQTELALAISPAEEVV